MSQTLSDIDSPAYSLAEVAHAAGGVPVQTLQQHLFRRLVAADKQLGVRGAYLFTARTAIRIALAVKLNARSNLSLRECYNIGAEFTDSGDGPSGWVGQPPIDTGRDPGAPCFNDGEPAWLRLATLHTGERRVDVVRQSEAIADGLEQFEDVLIVNLASVVRGTRMRLGLL